jgi:hypothetical protein
MKKSLAIAVASAFALLCGIGSGLFAAPSVYPTGVTIYKPDKCWNGYTVIATPVRIPEDRKDTTTYLIDMNGKEVKRWKNVHGCWSSKIMPGGFIMGSTARSRTEVFETPDLVEADWNDNIVWKFDKAGQVKVGDKTVWSARAHHDYQREGSPVGYYAPGMDMFVDHGKTLVNSSKVVNRPDITHVPVSDSWIIEVDWNGNILWDWLVTDHWDELGLSEDAKNAYYRNPGPDWEAEYKKHGYVKDVYTNNINWLGPNRWYDAGDERFNPENIIADIRALNVMFIISKKTKKIVWKVGPYFDSGPELRKIGQIVGMHHVHMIPKGLPGEGNILLFDNGGDAGFGAANPTAPSGVYNARIARSRVVEFNPVTLELAWQYIAPGALKDFTFFSPRCSGAQRLPNGNTLVTEAGTGRVFELTSKKEIVWEYMRPPLEASCEVFRAYRCPYEWIPQLPRPVERAVVPPKLSEFRIAPVGEAQTRPVDKNAAAPAGRPKGAAEEEGEAKLPRY